jgi:membrane-associated phospholipid phosphatase
MRVGKQVALVVCLVVLPVALSAQHPPTLPPAKKAPVKEAPARQAADTARQIADTSQKLALITKNDLLFAGGFVAGTVLASRLDRGVARFIQDTSRLPNVFRTNTASTFNLFAVPGAFIAGGGMYSIGRLIGNRGLADAGLHTTEAVLVAEGMTYVIKWTFGRERPALAGYDHPGLFRFFRGFKGKDYSSFPSGHASAAFAAAAAVITEIAGRRPKVAIVMAPVLFGSATLVAWARLESNKHWLSDVFMGAGMGTLVGIKVVRYNHKHPGNHFDRWLLLRLPAITPNVGRQNGVTLRWTWQPAFLN